MEQRSADCRPSPELVVTLIKIEGEEPSRQALTNSGRSALRTDLVQSKDHAETYYLVETGSHSVMDGANASRWKVLGPTDPHLFNKPLTGDPLYFFFCFYIKPQFVQEFINGVLEAAILVHKLDKDCVRYELQDQTECIAFEVVKNWAAIEFHHSLPHYTNLRQALFDWQAKPRSHDKGCRISHSA